MGVKLNTMKEPDLYRQRILEIGDSVVTRLMRPWIYSKFTFKLFGYKAELDKILKPVHKFSSGVIYQRRKFFHENNIGDAIAIDINENV